MLSSLKQELQSLANPEKAKILQGFFKTGKGQYGEGDVFLGIRVPNQRKIAKKYNLSLSEIQELLISKIHEYRMIGLLILMNKYKKSSLSKRAFLEKKASGKKLNGEGDFGEKKTSLKEVESRNIQKKILTKRQIFEFYLKNIRNINNWDLVDISAPRIVGDFLQREDTEILKQLAKSENLWERRIAIVSTYAFIKKRNFGNTLAISEILLKDEHDLIHKAVGWMLREIGKRNKNVLEIFLSTRYKEMPRTMLRYSIEKFSKEEKDKYLKKEKKSI